MPRGSSKQRLTVSRAAVALALCILIQSCVVLFASRAAPTLDAKESPELLDDVHGSIVVAQGEDSLLVASLPDGTLLEVETAGDAVAASGIDERGRIAYVRRTSRWLQSEPSFSLILKTLATGEERTVSDVVGADPFDRLMRVSLAGNLAGYACTAPRPRIFDLDSGKEVDLSWWQEG